MKLSGFSTVTVNQYMDSWLGKEFQKESNDIVLTKSDLI